MHSDEVVRKIQESCPGATQITIQGAVVSFDVHSIDDSVVEDLKSALGPVRLSIGARTKDPPPRVPGSTYGGSARPEAVLTVTLRRAA